MAYLVSGKVTVFPTALRGGEYLSGKFTSEANITGIVRSASSNDSYVIKKENNNIEFILKGYHFDINVEEITTRPLYAWINIDNNGRLISLDGTTELDKGGNFMGLGLGQSVPASVSGSIYLLDSSGNIPAESMVQVKSDKIENYTTGDLNKVVKTDGSGHINATGFNGPITGDVTGNVTGNVSGNAGSADKLNSNAGSTTQPIYFNNGTPTACSYSVEKSVPVDALFTDTNYKIGYIKKEGELDRVVGLYKNNPNNPEQWDLSSTVRVGYADQSGISSKVTTDNDDNNAGSLTKPVYILGGNVKECEFEVKTNVPENAVFSDTTYTAGAGLSLNGTTFNLNLSYPTSGNNYKVEQDTNKNLFVNVPQENTKYSLSADTTNNVIKLNKDGSAQNTITVPFSTKSNILVDDNKSAYSVGSEDQFIYFSDGKPVAGRKIYVQSGTPTAAETGDLWIKI